MKRLLIFILTLALLTVSASALTAEEEAAMDAADVPASVFEDVSPTDAVEIPAPSAILMEKETGTVVWEKNADERLHPASVTKVMTILLIAEAVEAGTISMDDLVPISANAAGMGGSQVFLEEGETMTLKDVFKCIVVSSANDAAVAAAELIAGTEAAFVQRMNDRAAELGMANTVFCNCTGLMDPGEHLTTARDIAIMSRELLTHEWVREYTTIWMDTIRDGAFGLSNTNKLIYYYDGATGLKTGFTREAGYCLSASAERNGIEYIAVVMHCETSPDRFESAKALLSYGFANYTLIPAVPDEALPPVRVLLGESAYVQPELRGEPYILADKQTAAQIEKLVELENQLTAPVAAGDRLGQLTIRGGEKELAVIPIVAGDEVARLTWGQIFVSILKLAFCGG